MFFPIDFAVGAPYADNGNNTGAVYIYYGNSDRTVFETQVPFKVKNVLFMYVKFCIVYIYTS